MPAVTADCSRPQALNQSDDGNRRKQQEVIVAEIIDFEAAAGEQPAQFRGPVAAAVMMGGVMVAPQPAHRWYRYQQPPVRFQARAHRAQGTPIVVQVFENVGHHNQVKSMVSEREVSWQGSSRESRQAARSS